MWLQKQAMNNLLYLGEQEFYVDKGTKGPVICTQQQGVIFVMFHANPGQCQFCDIAKPEFMKLAQIIAGAKFGLCNLMQCANLVERSQRTIMPLRNVPLFILFYNGRPFINYSGEKQLKHFARFMQEMLQRLSNQQVFSQGGFQQLSLEEAEKTPHGLAYDYDSVSSSDPNTCSLTCNEDGVCYLASKEIYGAQQQQPPPQQQQSPPPMMMQQQQQQPYYPPQQPQQFYQQPQQPYYPQQQQQQYNPYINQQQQQQQPYYPMQQQQQQPQPQFYQR